MLVGIKGVPVAVGLCLLRKATHLFMARFKRGLRFNYQRKVKKILFEEIPVLVAKRHKLKRKTNY